MHQSDRFVNVVVSSVLLLLVSSTALAREPMIPDRGVVHRGITQRTVAPLLYTLPERGAGTLEIRFLQGDRLLVREQVSVPASRPSGAMVDVLYTHLDELKRLRAMEAREPGSVRFTASLDDRLLTDDALAIIDGSPSKPATTALVGEVREVEVHLKDKLRATTNTDPDPQCEADCQAQYQDCIDRCDQRSNDCALCWDAYRNCSSNCIPQCSEPKSTSTYQVWTLLSYSYYGESGCYSPYYQTSSTGDQYGHFYVHYQITTYQRTEHCDGSHTDTQTGQTTTYVWCWAATGQSCNNPTAPPPYGEICP